MQFLKALFGGGGSGNSGAGEGAIWLYVRPKGCDEVVRVRLHLSNDVSPNDDYSGYFAHKVIRGEKCRQNVEIDLHFSGNRQLTDSQITGGEFTDQAAYNAYRATLDEGAAP
jgi:hypothetical protein